MGQDHYRTSIHSYPSIWKCAQRTGRNVVVPSWIMSKQPSSKVSPCLQAPIIAIYQNQQLDRNMDQFIPVETWQVKHTIAISEGKPGPIWTILSCLDCRQKCHPSSIKFDRCNVSILVILIDKHTNLVCYRHKIQGRYDNQALVCRPATSHLSTRRMTCTSPPQQDNVLEAWQRLESRDIPDSWKRSQEIGRKNKHRRRGYRQRRQQSSSQVHFCVFSSITCSSQNNVATPPFAQLFRL